MKYVVQFLFMALVAVAAAQPLNQNANDTDDVAAAAQPLNQNANATEDELMTLLGRIITEPITLPCKLALEAHEKLHDPDYKPSSLLGHLLKGAHDVCDGIIVGLVGERKKKEKKAAKPLIIKNLIGKVKDKLDDEDREPLTIGGKLVKKVHNKLNDEDYEPLTLAGKLVKKTHEVVSHEIDVRKEKEEKKNAKKAAKPLIIKNIISKIKDKLDDEDHEPLTIAGKLVKKVHNKLNDEDYEPLTLTGKVVKKVHNAVSEKIDENKEKKEE